MQHKFVKYKKKEEEEEKMIIEQYKMNNIIYHLKLKHKKNV